MRYKTCNLQTVSALLLTIILLAACTAPTAAPSPSSALLPTPAGEAVSTPLPPTGTAPISSPTPAPGRIRQAAVAGSWYPDDPDELTQVIDGMLATASPIDGHPIGLIVPHAGYAYSGQVAAVGFRQLEGAQYDVAIVIASDHQPPLSSPISVWSEGGFETPLGTVAVDAELAQALVDADPRITFDPTTHEGEHPIEIELPFLQRVCPSCSIVPVLMGSADEETVQALAEALMALLPGRRAVVIASSDLSHYPTYDDALVADGATLGAIETGEPESVRRTIETVMASGLSGLVTCACGEGPILVTMHVARGLGADTVTVMRYANSGQVSGDHSQVVGYGAVMLWRYELPALTGPQQEELLALVRSTIAEYLEAERLPAYETDDPALTRRSGAFVTLKQHGELRGCIGHTWADLPLYQAVQQTAVSAATEDPRFAPLTPDELSEITVEISVLSPFRRLTDTEDVEVGTHGLMIFKDGHQGLLLPQVPVEQGWDRAEYLDNLCLKAGMPTDCWKEGATLYAFTAIVFGEEK
jgi:AmmeMemoRadiSam system protein B/AmmeMemoRadiSam system protein A